MRISSELNSEDLHISTYLPQFRYDFVRALGIFSGSAPLRPEIFTPFIAGYRAHNNYNVQYRNTWHSHLIQKSVIVPPNTFVSYLAHFCTDLLDSWGVRVPYSTLRYLQPQRRPTTAFLCCCTSHCCQTCCHLLWQTGMLCGLDMG